VVQLQNAKDGRGPDYLGTFGPVQGVFKSGVADPAARTVVVRLAPRPARVQDRDLAPARDQANRLIGEPVTLRWQGLSWTVSRDELAGMLRYQPTANGGTSAYLARDALLAKATAIGHELEGNPQGPKDPEGKPRVLDVPATASALWIQASTVDHNRAADVVQAELPEPTPTPEAEG
jgi:hypothetical protein